MKAKDNRPNFSQEAVELCEQFHPDVILMDLVMPEMDGVTATRIIRERWLQVQVIALTSFQERTWCRMRLRLGPSATCSKTYPWMT